MSYSLGDEQRLNDNGNILGILNDLSELVTIRINSFSESQHTSGYIEHKSHHDYDLWIVQEGSLQITVNGKSAAAMTGDVVFFYPGMLYRATVHSPKCRFVYLHFDFRMGDRERMLNDFPLAGIIRGSLIREEVLLFMPTYQRLKQHGSLPGNRLYLKACLTAILAKIVELNVTGDYTGQFADGMSPGRTGKNLDILQPVLAHIDAHLHQSLKIGELAALVGLSEKYFIPYFKQALGITPGQYIYQIKMNRARDYLHEKKYTVQQIAERLGYPDPFTFSKAFKKYYNVAPSKFD